MVLGKWREKVGKKKRGGWMVGKVHLEGEMMRVGKAVMKGHNMVHLEKEHLCKSVNNELGAGAIMKTFFDGSGNVGTSRTTVQGLKSSKEKIFEAIWRIFG
ncbi:unnamed protein product [Dovyalis caffra]|uniref:Uncharacterized protein n=1 Tax=Dovyalis caffra TaxID=77055 RepID=A0AAV1S2B8_9ROSI|nr:unnamed protein product [Dovyalis caffra]